MKLPTHPKRMMEEEDLGLGDEEEENPHIPPKTKRTSLMKQQAVYRTGTPVRSARRIGSLTGDVPAGWEGEVEYLTEDTSQHTLYAVRWQMTGKIAEAREEELEMV